MRELLHELGRIAADQHGAFNRVQALDAGANDNDLAVWVQQGAVRRDGHGVYCFSGAPRTWLQSVRVATLEAGRHAVASCETALALWDIEDVPHDEPHIAIPRGLNHRIGPATTHEMRDLDEARVTVRYGIPVTGVLRAVLDDAMTAPLGTVKRRLESARRRYDISAPAAVDAIRRHARPGRTGIRKFRQAVVHEYAHRANDSRFEHDANEILRRAGVLGGQSRFRTLFRDGTPVEFDIAWPEVRVAVELVGGDHFRRRRVMLSDLVRRNRANLDEWLILEFDYDLVIGSPEIFVAQVLQALALRSAA
ncbi:MAG TPA: hypothetical protein VMW08_06235 [Acidimicrobiales bacterium]|nr:hypothetical protein [Acidimicrobiales bacterium]